MRSPVVWALFVLLLATMHGCALFVPERSANDVQIQRWLRTQQFGSAIAALKYRNQERPSARSNTQLHQAVAQANEYDRTMAAAALKQQAKGDWEGALAAVEQGLSNYPAGKQLRAARTTLRQRQQQRLDELEVERLTAKAEWLLRTAPVVQEMSRVDIDNLTAAWQAKHIQEEISTTAATLSRIGSKALAQKKLRLAEHCLTVADRLQFSETTSKNLAKLARIRYLAQLKEERRQKQVRQAEKKQQQLEQAKQQRQRARALTAAMQRALKSANLPKARNLLGRLNQLDHDNPDLVDLQQALDDAIAAKIRELTEKGDLLYSRGQIEQAKAIWVQALPLDPGNAQIRFRIDRATRVLEKLRELQEQDQSGQATDNGAIPNDEPRPSTR